MCKRILSTCPGKWLCIQEVAGHKCSLADHVDGATALAGYMKQAGDLFNMLMLSGRLEEAVGVQQDRLRRMVPAPQRTLLDIASMEQLAEVLCLLLYLDTIESAFTCS